LFFFIVYRIFFGCQNIFNSFDKGIGIKWNAVYSFLY
jgi:hypothetical protein